MPGVLSRWLGPEHRQVVSQHPWRPPLPGALTRWLGPEHQQWVSHINTTPKTSPKHHTITILKMVMRSRAKGTKHQLKYWIKGSRSLTFGDAGKAFGREIVEMNTVRCVLVWFRSCVKPFMKDDRKHSIIPGVWSLERIVKDGVAVNIMNNVFDFYCSGGQLRCGTSWW